MSLESIEAKLDTLIAKLDHIGGAVEPSSVYDHAPLSADEVVADGATFNKDGSLWSTWNGEADEKHGLTPGQKIQIAFGYISPVKTPDIWAAAQRFLTPQGFLEWDSAWKRNPFGVYRADPREMLAKGVINVVSFSYLVQPFTTVVQ